MFTKNPPNIGNIAAVEKQHYEMPEFVGLKTIVILDTKCMNIDAVSVFGPAFWLLFKSDLSYCDVKFDHQRGLEPMHSFDGNPEADGENKGFKINPLFMKS